MKKTINVSLGGVGLTLEDDAYARLESYLSQVRSHFAAYADREEIVRDIEARIAEQLLAMKPGGSMVVLGDIEKVIGTMGMPEQFGDAEERVNSGSNADGKTKRLFRNTDDAIAAGVASGLAAYFDIDTVWVRLIFFVSIFFGGTGVIVYIVLWMIVPEAKTDTEKMQMRGERISIAGLEQTLKEKAEELKKRDNGRVRKVVHSFFQGTGHLVGKAFSVLFKILGTVLTIGMSLALASLVVVLVNVLFNSNSPYIEFPLQELSRGAAYYTVLFGGFFLVFVPLVLLLLLGVRLIMARAIVKTSVWVSLCALWLVAGIASATAGVHIAPEVQNVVENSPYFKTVSREFAVPAFNTLKLDGVQRVTLHQAQENRVVANGQEIDLDRLRAEVVDGVLTFKQERRKEVCLFCVSRFPHYDVYGPEIKSLVLSDAARADGHMLGDFLKITAEDASRVNLTFATLDLKVESRDASRVELAGDSTKTQVKTYDVSRVNFSPEFLLGDTEVLGEDISRVYLGRVKSLLVRLKDMSRVFYSSAETVESHLEDRSSVGPSTQEAVSPPLEPVPPLHIE